MYQLEAKKFINLCQQAKKILIISHAKPDGDSLGSCLALADYLDLKGKNYDLFCCDKPAQYYNYLPKINEFQHQKNEIKLSEYDLIVCLDHGSLEMSGLNEELKKVRDQNLHTTLANIDHHASNNHFGNFNLIDPQASSTAEILYKIFKENNIKINKKMATCLMTGIITDTGHFTNAATQQSSLDAASELVRLGAKIPQIAQKVIRNKNIPSLNLWGEVFSRLIVNPKYQLAYTVITQKDLEKKNLNMESLDGLVNFLQSLNDVKVVLLLIEEGDNKIKGSLRTTNDKIDVSKLASIWGGGGHTKAAGFKIEGRLSHNGKYWQVT